MKTKQRPSAEVQAELDDAKHRLTNLRANLKVYEAKVKETSEAIFKLEGSTWGRSNGVVGKLQSELEKSKLHEADQSAKPVVWKEQPRYLGVDMIVSRVTKKRIYVRQPGLKYETTFSRGGTHVGSRSDLYGIIDVEATLGSDYEN